MMSCYAVDTSSSDAAKKSLKTHSVSPSAVVSLKAIFSLLMGLSVTNTLVVLVRAGQRGSVQWLSALHTKPTISAGVLLFTIARFYLGNIRHIDDTFASPLAPSLALTPNSRRARRFVLDFCVLLVEALMFGLASFYVSHPSDLLAIMIALLIVDTCWNRATQAVSTYQQVWFINNFIHSALMFGCYAGHLSALHATAWTYAGIALLFSNGLFDFCLSRFFYFADPAMGRYLFLSAPFTGVLDSEGHLPQELQNCIQTVTDRLEAHGWKVFSAHRRERWGAAIDTPYSSLMTDITAIRRAQYLVAIIGSPPSPGVQLEVGFALAHGKRVLIVCDANDSLPYLIRGLIEHESAACISGHQYNDAHELAVLVEQHIGTP